ncbi:MAG: hypothetical protein KGJ86_10210, partial [Chloroflexota bacterium]|nr:hypothetical protein [Chloroflexota bacterium]
VLTTGGLIGAVIAGFLACGHTSLTRILSFTSILDVGWLTFGIASATSNGWRGALILLAVRVVAKPLMVLANGVQQQLAREPTGNRAPQPLARTRATAGAWCLGALAMVGFPLTGGFWGMKLLFQTALGMGLLHVVLLGLSVLLAALAYAKATRQLFSPDRKPAIGQPEPIVPASVLAVAGVSMVAIGIFPGLVQGVISPIAASLPFLR